MRQRWLVAGVVQGVGFRWFVVREGRRLGLTGWARNLPDGRVEIEASGTEAALAALARAIGTGPPAASVAMVESSVLADAEPESQRFVVR